MQAVEELRLHGVKRRHRRADQPQHARGAGTRAHRPCCSTQPPGRTVGSSRSLGERPVPDGAAWTRGPCRTGSPRLHLRGNARRIVEMASLQKANDASLVRPTPSRTPPRGVRGRSAAAGLAPARSGTALTSRSAIPATTARGRCAGLGRAAMHRPGSPRMSKPAHAVSARGPRPSAPTTASYGSALASPAGPARRRVVG